MIFKKATAAVSVGCVAAVLLAFFSLDARSGASGSGSASPTPTPLPASTYRIRFDGLGPVNVGMKPAEAMKEFALTENRYDDESDCYYLEMKSQDPESAPGRVRPHRQ